MKVSHLVGLGGGEMDLMVGSHSLRYGMYGVYFRLACHCTVYYVNRNK